MTLVNHTNNVLSQLADLLDCLEPQQYNQALEILFGSSIGKHFRHIVEFYQCLLDGLEQQTVNYDDRKRNPLIENDLYYSRQLLQQLIQQIQAQTEDIPLQLIVCYESSGAEYQLQSGFFRELAYNIEHTVHHMDIIKVSVHQAFQEIQLQPDVGIAYSTIQYQTSQI